MIDGISHHVRKRIFIASISVLSSLVSLPSISSRTCLPQALAKSRTTRGNLLHKVLMDCMRVFITFS